MAFKAIVSDLAEVPEAHRPYYAKIGDVFCIQADDLDDHPVVKNMKADLERAKAQKRKLKEGLAKANEAYAAAKKAARQAYLSSLDELSKEIGDEVAPPATE